MSWLPGGALIVTLPRLLPGLSAGGQGCITRLVNLYQLTYVKLYNFFVDGQRETAETLKLEVATAGWESRQRRDQWCQVGGGEVVTSGIKFGLQSFPPGILE